MPPKTFDEPCPLLVETIRLIKEHGVDATAHKTKVPFGWLYSMTSGKVRSPSVNRVIHVYETLSQTKLPV